MATALALSRRPRSQVPPHGRSRQARRGRTPGARTPADSLPASLASHCSGAAATALPAVQLVRLFALPIFERLFGNPAAEPAPGVYQAAEDILGRPFTFISLIPFAAKDGGSVGDYRVGFWPAERRRTRSPAYGNPEGFIEVTPENRDVSVSEHFRLGDFLTHDQQNVWPKYLVLREALVDKLELVIEDLADHGVRVDRMVVMSGFRTPQYNAKGVGRGGRARDSRHQYGDAADVFVDNDGNGRMDDLNHDKRVDSRDARVIKGPPKS